MGYEEDERREMADSTSTSAPPLQFGISDRPPVGQLLFLGLQQMMIAVSALLVVPYLLAETLCAGASTFDARVRLISGSFISVGVATLLQCLIGTRLPILQGPSFAFIPAIVAYGQLPSMKCMHNRTESVPEHEWMERMLTMQGSLALSSLVLILAGAFGLVGVLATRVGPVTIVPMMLLLCLQTVPTIEQKLSLHWISVVEVVILIVVAVYLDDVRVPLPTLKKRLGRWQFGWTRIRLFGMFPYLLSVSIAWLICHILTLTNLEPEGGAARTDQPDATEAWRAAPWLRLMYPGYWGKPTVSTGLALGFSAASLVTVVESVGNYALCTRIAHLPPPPTSTINRGILVEGLGSLFAALMGTGVGVTTYSENMALLQVTRVASRYTLVAAGIFYLLTGLFTRAAVLLASIPDAIIGGVLCMGISMIAGVGLSNLKKIDLTRSRNVFCMGTALILGSVIPTHVTAHPIQIGFSRDVEQVVNMMLSMQMFVGSLIALVLDNTVPGSTPAERGLTRSKSLDRRDEQIHEAYELHPLVYRAMLSLPILQRLPFLPSKEWLQRWQDKSKIAPAAVSKNGQHARPVEAEQRNAVGESSYL